MKRRDRCSIYVATIEKANILINSLIIEDRISELGVIVIDEVRYFSYFSSLLMIFSILFTSLELIFKKLKEVKGKKG